MEEPETKKEVAEKVFGVEYHTLWVWTKKGVPKRRRARVDAVLKRREERNGVKHSENILQIISQWKRLGEPPEVVRRFAIAFPTVWDAEAAHEKTRCLEHCLNLQQREDDREHN